MSVVISNKVGDTTTEGTTKPANFQKIKLKFFFSFYNTYA